MKKLIVIAAVAALFVSQAGFALDLEPPWWRGEWSTTSQIWEFYTQSFPGIEIDPDGPAPGGIRVNLRSLHSIFLVPFD